MSALLCMARLVATSIIANCMFPKLTRVKRTSVATVVSSHCCMFDLPCYGIAGMIKGTSTVLFTVPAVCSYEY
eukprot:scaffold424315_cov17-Prasinocladus_malaysianus.AAC.1